MGVPSLVQLILFVVSVSALGASPHIVFVLLDDLGFNDVSFRTSVESVGFNTSFIDSLASDGIILDQYYVQPLCSPSRTALLSSRYPYSNGLAHGVITNGHPVDIPLNQKLLSDRLKENGYQTHMLGKWDGGMTYEESCPWRRGFDSFHGYLGAAEDYFKKEWASDCAPLTEVSAVDFRVEKIATRVTNYSTSYYSDEALRIIDEADTAVPLFLYLAYQCPHWPLEVPHGDTPPQCAHIRWEPRRLFCTMLAVMQEGLQRIVERLQRRHMWHNTLLVFSTDNGAQTNSMGGGSNYPLRGSKATVFEGGVRGAAFLGGGFLARHARLPNRSSTLFHLVDFGPSLISGLLGKSFSVAQGSVPVDGVDAWHQLLHSGASPRDLLLLQLDPVVNQTAIRDSRGWKLIVGNPTCTWPDQSRCPDGWVPIGGPIERAPANPSGVWLFDLASDPNERSNVAADHPEHVSRLLEAARVYADKMVVQHDPPCDQAALSLARRTGFWQPWRTLE